MPKSVYVGNIPFKARPDDISELFSQFGEVDAVTFIRDRNSGRFRGFGFVIMDDEGAKQAIEKLNETEFMGRSLRVNEAIERPKERQPD